MEFWKMDFFTVDYEIISAATQPPRNGEHCAGNGQDGFSSTRGPRTLGGPRTPRSHGVFYGRLLAAEYKLLSSV